MYDLLKIEMRTRRFSPLACISDQVVAVARHRAEQAL